MKIGLLGKKLGMTRLYDEWGTAVPVTVVHVGDNRVLQVKTAEKDGYDAVQVGYGSQKPQRETMAQLGHFKRSGSEPKRFIREFRLGQVPADLGAMTTLDMDQFTPGDYVDVIGTSKGKGFQGVMKRYNFQGQPDTHGSMMHRRTGAIGCRSTPGLIWKNQKMPGHMGDDRVTHQNLVVMKTIPEDGVILIRGAIPGCISGYVVLRPSKKKGDKKAHFGPPRVGGKEAGGGAKTALKKGGAKKK